MKQEEGEGVDEGHDSGDVGEDSQSLFIPMAVPEHCPPPPSSSTKVLVKKEREG